ncbi:hypothetical protein [Bacillus inaquosorum]|uniref:hypothetical protein n=1 Tax=Bacillus inaquosorum TaxID=483913 RepID=UPI002282F44B|nr:hypothetical protein [Bacillus inaquosorum]MCY8073358.1 hypothetical protein [Bacillus inaquosorum]MCY9380817.1 hypothetical protein [Bacillus inaquosorum]
MMELKKDNQELMYQSQNGSGISGYYPAFYPAYPSYTNYHPPVNVNHSHHNFVPDQGMKWPKYFIVKPVFEEAEEFVGYGRLLSIDASRNSENPEIIDFKIYSRLGTFYRGSIHQDEPRQDLTNLTVEIVYRGFKVRAKLNGWIENTNSELCLRGQLKFKFLDQPITIDLGRDCDSY